MYFKYGSYQHADGEVALSSFQQRVGYSARGYRQVVTKVMTIQGVLIASTQAALKSAIEALEAAYDLPGQDAGLYHDDDTVSPHFLDSSASIGGTRVVALDYPQGGGGDGEYATGRTFSITIEADFADLTHGLISAAETVRSVGTGGPRIVGQETITGLPQMQTTNQRTLCRATQSGLAIGYLAWPDSSVPGPIWPQWEQQDQRSIDRMNPTRTGNTLTMWPISWSYSFLSPTPLVGHPHLP